MKLRNDSTWHLVHNSQRLLDNMVPKHHKAKKKADIRLFPQFEYKKKKQKRIRQVLGYYFTCPRS